MAPDLKGNLMKRQAGRSTIHRVVFGAAVGLMMAGGGGPSDAQGTAAQASGEAPTAGSSRAERIESGLLAPIQLKGVEPERMSLAERMAHYEVKGLSVAIIDDFEIVWTQGFGVVQGGTEEPVTPTTIFQAGSISKPVATLVALRLVAAGQLALDDPVNDRLTSWKLPDSEAGGPEPVRIRDLLTHSAGLAPFIFAAVPATEERPPLPELLDGQGTPGVTRAEPRGRRFLYSNPAFGVLQQLLVDVGGKPFDQIARKEVFDPLGMKSSSFASVLPPPLFELASYGHDQQGEPIPGKGLVVPGAVGGLWTTPTDLCLFLLGLFEANRDEGDFLPRVLANGMVTRQFEDRGFGTEIAASGEARRAFHGGGLPGFVAFMVGYPDTGQGAVVMVNSGGWSLMHEILRAVAVEYDWPGFVVEREVVAMAPEAFARFAGRYEFEARPDVKPSITTRSGRFYYGKWEMLPVSDTMFVIPDLGTQIEFVIESTGRANSCFFGEPGTSRIRLRRIE